MTGVKIIHFWRRMTSHAGAFAALRSMRQTSDSHCFITWNIFLQNIRLQLRHILKILEIFNSLLLMRCPAIWQHWSHVSQTKGKNVAHDIYYVIFSSRSNTVISILNIIHHNQETQISLKYSQSSVECANWLITNVNECSFLTMQGIKNSSSWLQINLKLCSLKLNILLDLLCYSINE